MNEVNGGFKMSKIVKVLRGVLIGLGVITVIALLAPTGTQEEATQENNIVQVKEEEQEQEQQPAQAPKEAITQEEAKTLINLYEMKNKLSSKLFMVQGLTLDKLELENNKLIIKIDVYDDTLKDSIKNASLESFNNGYNDILNKAFKSVVYSTPINKKIGNVKEFYDLYSPTIIFKEFLDENIKVLDSTTYKVN